MWKWGDSFSIFINFEMTVESDAVLSAIRETWGNCIT